MTLVDYVASVPERAVRATAAVGGGAIAETSKVLLPRVVRDGRLYQSTVERLLRIVVELVGGVEGVYAPDGHYAEAAPLFGIEVLKPGELLRRLQA